MKNPALTIRITSLLLFSSLVFRAQVNTPSAVGSSSNELNAQLSNSGLRFTPNKGQIADTDGNLQPDILYYGETQSTAIYLRKTGISYVQNDMSEVMHKINGQLEELVQMGVLAETDKQSKQDELLQKEKINIHRVDMDFAGANNNCQLVNEDELQGFNNYYYAHCPNGILNVKQYNKVTYKNIYKGIDITYYASPEHSRRGNKEQGLKYNLIVQPHADPNQIKIHWKGAKEIKLDGSKLQVESSLSTMTETLPKVYQNINGKIVDVECKYKLEEVGSSKLEVRSKYATRLIPNTSYLVHFELGTYNLELPLVVDPWVTYYGGVDHAESSDIATDNLGNIYFTGYVNGSSFPIGSAGGMNTTWQGTFGGNEDAFVVKFDKNGNRVWSTFYGGNTKDQGSGITTDNLNNVIITGRTEGGTFPIGNSGGGNITWQGTFGGGGLGLREDAFIVKFDENGSRLWSTFYGGNAKDRGNGIAIDNLNNVIITGKTGGGAFPVGNAGGGNVTWQGVLGGSEDVFVVKFNSNGNRLWSTFFGGKNYDEAYAVATDNTGNVIISGWNASGSFPTGNAGGVNATWQGAYGGGNTDAFVVKFDKNGSRLWSTYYGGGQMDISKDISTDNLGNVIIAGYTEGGTFPTGNSGGGNVTWQGIYGGGVRDAVAVKFDGNGNRLWSTFLGGSDWDYAYSVAVDRITNEIYITGDTYSLNFPTTSCAWHQNLIGGNEDVFITHLMPTGDLYCSSYVGTAKHEEMCFVATHDCYVYLTGYTEGSFPEITSSSWQPSIVVISDIYLTQMNKNTCSFNVPTNTLISTKKNSTSCTPCNGNATIQINSSCTGSTLYSYVWSDGTKTLNTNITTQTLTGLCPGNYWVEVAGNCNQVQTATFVITGTTCGSITASVNSVTMCSGNTSCPTLTATGGNGTSPYTYSWSTGATTQNISPCPLATTTYTVKVTDKTGASATTTATVTVYPAVTANITSININCNGASTGSATATGSGGTSPYTYSWSTGATTTGASSTIPNLSANTYSVTVTDNKGCTTTTSVTLTAPPPLLGQFTKGTAACANCGCQEWIMATSTGGTPPYTYQWPDGYSNRYKNKICAGNYTIKVTDKNGCSVDVNVTAP